MKEGELVMALWVFALGREGTLEETPKMGSCTGLLMSSPVGELSKLTPSHFFFTQVPVGSDSQNVVQPPFQQPMLVPASQSVQGGLPAGGVPVYYSMIPAAQQNGTR